MSIVTQNMRMQRAEERIVYNKEVFEKIGRKPFGARVLVEIPTETEAEKDSSGDIRRSGIIIPKEILEKERSGQTVCRITAIGADAWYDVYDAPNVGDWVVIKRYGGIDIRGNDGKRYRAPLDIEIYVGTTGNDDVDYIG